MFKRSGHTVYGILHMTLNDIIKAISFGIRQSQICLNKPYSTIPSRLDLHRQMEESIQDIFQRTAVESESYVRYSIYFPEDASSIENLQQICAEIQDQVHQLMSDYIWQKDRFGISITRSSLRGKLFLTMSFFQSAIADTYFRIPKLKRYYLPSSQTLHTHSCTA